ncbi:MAG: TIGR03936 family radical SAM-associated protein [Candidatus Brocadiia bacterium]
MVYDPTVLAFKIRLEFCRDELGSYFPHQDVLNAFERAVRRAGVPIRFTEGFDPHPRIALPYALSVGIAGEQEILEIELSAWRKPSEIVAGINEFLPRGIKALRAWLIDARRASFVVTSMTFEAAIPDELRDRAHAGATQLLASETYVVERGNEDGSKRRQVDIKQYIESLTIEGSRLVMKLAYTLKGTARPREIVEAVVGPGTIDVRLVPIRKLSLEIRNAD